MKFEINSTKHGTKEVLIDDEDWKIVKNYTWHISYDKTINNFYISSSGWDKFLKIKSKGVLLHRLIMDCPKEMQVDHINHNTLDNRKENLRICTSAENNRNRKKRVTGTTSKYMGVCFDKQRNKYRSRIYVNKKYLDLGRYKTQEEAAVKYNIKAIELFGQYASLNVTNVT